MSYYNEVIIWQSPDGTWNNGHYEMSDGCGGECGDETHEWCREPDWHNFSWVSTGHPSQDAAWRAWDGANPGGYTSSPHDPENPGANAEYEDIAARKYEEAVRRADEARREGRGSSGIYWGGRSYSTPRQTDYWGYEGPPKQRSLASIQRERLDARLTWAGHRLGGYANGLDTDRDSALLAQCKERLKTATPQERAAYWDAMAEHAAAVRRKRADRDERKREEARRNSRYGMPRYGGYDSGAAARRAQQEAADAEVEAWAARVEKAVADVRTPTPEAAPAPATAQVPAPKAAPVAAPEQARALKPAAASQAAPAKKTQPAKTQPVKAAPARKKTTAKSTAGSFAPREHGAPGKAAALDPQSAPPVGPAQPDPWDL